MRFSRDSPAGPGHRRAARSGGEAVLRGSIHSVQTGRIAPLGSAAVPSAYVKQRADGPVAISALGLSGDEQADKRVHGGVDKAVYCYPLAGYPLWAAAFPRLGDRFVPASMGENLTLNWFDEAGTYIGDTIRVGGVVLQVTQPRQPCAKLAAYFGEPALVRAMLTSARCGWYARVLEPGAVAAGDPVELVERNNPEWSVRRFALAVAAKAIDEELLAEMVAMPGLAEAWQLKALGLLAKLKRGE